jgi:hypothetical protein
MMIVVEYPVHPTLESLSHAVKSWVEDGNGSPLARWMGRELDSDGVPTRLAIADWHRCLEILAAGRRQVGDWPPESEEAIAGLLLATLRLARPDGSPSMHAVGPRFNPPAWAPADWVGWYRGTGIARVLGWWFTPGRRETAPPPLPAWSAPDRVLAMLRADWLTDGDFLAVDHRDAQSPCRFELRGRGRTWLGPEWGDDMTGPEGSGSRPRPVRWVTGSAADLLEWSHRVDGVRVTRSALLMRGRRLALFSILAEGREATWGADPTMRLAMPPLVAAGPIKESRALVLTEPGRRGAAQALPVALPCLPYPTERGSFRAVDGALVLRQRPAGRRCWLPLLISWDPDRHRKPVNWRVLTVSERSRAVGPDRAFAARVSWGRHETYVVYRSLGPPARRAFLGHQTAARFLIAGFDEDGDLTPIFTVE